MTVASTRLWQANWVRNVWHKYWHINVSHKLYVLLKWGDLLPLEFRLRIGKYQRCCCVYMTVGWGYCWHMKYPRALTWNCEEHLDPVIHHLRHLYATAVPAKMILQTICIQDDDQTPGKRRLFQESNENTNYFARSCSCTSCCCQFYLRKSFLHTF